MTNAHPELVEMWLGCGDDGGICSRGILGGATSWSREDETTCEISDHRDRHACPGNQRVSLPNAIANVRANQMKCERSELPQIARQVQRTLGITDVVAEVTL